MPDKTIQQIEAEYKLSWIEDHRGADETVYDTKTNQPVSATYYYPPHRHEQEQKAFFTQLGELARIDEMSWGIEQYEPLVNIKDDRLTYGEL